MGMGLGTLGSRFGRLGNAPSKGVGVPAWASGTDLWKDFTVPKGSLADPTDTHASTIYAPNAAGVYAPFAANVLTRTDLGLQTVPTRTNLCTYSSTFFNTAWGKSSGTAVADNTIVAPDGTTTASALTGGSADSTVSNAITPIASTTYTVSVWLKVPSGTLSINMYLNGGGILVHLSCALTTSWQRFTVTGTTSTTASMALQIGGANRWGNGVVIHAWNGQTEVGAFASPPIPTTSAAVTVNGNQQVIDLTGRLGTGVAGIVQMNLLEVGSNYRKTMRIADASATNFIDLYYNGGNLNLNLTAASVTQAELSLGVWPSGICTVAFAVSGNFVQGRIVGVAPVSADVVATYPATLDRVGLGGNGASANENIYQFTRKLALSFGAQDATTFAAMYARAVLAAAA